MADDKLFNESLIDFLNKMPDYKKRMLNSKMHETKTVCPQCGGVLLLQLRGTKNHMWASCRDCTFRIIE